MGLLLCLAFISKIVLTFPSGTCTIIALSKNKNLRQVVENCVTTHQTIARLLPAQSWCFSVHICLSTSTAPYFSVLSVCPRAASYMSLVRQNEWNENSPNNTLPPRMFCLRNIDEHSKLIKIYQLFNNYVRERFRLCRDREELGKFFLAKLSTGSWGAWICCRDFLGLRGNLILFPFLFFLSVFDPSGFVRDTRLWKASCGRLRSNITGAGLFLRLTRCSEFPRLGTGTSFGLFADFFPENLLSTPGTSSVNYSGFNKTLKNPD